MKIIGIHNGCAEYQIGFEVAQESMLTTTRVSNFDDLRQVWDNLHHQSQACSVFTSYSWQTTWWACFGNQAELQLLGIWENDVLRGIAPLMQYEGWISFIGGRAVSDVLDFIAYPGYEERVAAAVADYLSRKSWNGICLRGLQASSPSIRAFKLAAEQMGAKDALEAEEVSPVSELESSWDAQLATMSKKDRHELRRKIRRLDASASWRWYCISGSDTTSQELDDFLRLMRLSATEKACFMTSRMEQFFRAAMRPLLDMQIAYMYFLEVDNKRVSATICFDQCDELWLYNSGFDPAYSSLSVGLLLKALCLKDAIERGKRRFDFLRGAEPYKYDLGAHDQPLFSLRLSRTDGVVSCHFLDEFDRPKETTTCLE
jgi:CelD/BcsL family acetyltransferase involved in cellulose biosynthesis